MSAGLLASLAVPAVDGAVLAMAIAGIGFRPATVLFAAATWVLLALLAPARHRIAPRISDQAGALIGSVAAPMVVVGPLIAGDAGAPDLLSALPLVAGAVVVGRTASYTLLRRARRREAEPTLLVGAGTAGIRLARLLTEHPEFGLSPVGFVDHAAEGELPLPWLGDLSRTTDLIHSSGARRVIVTLGVAPEASIVETVRECVGAPVEIHVVPPLAALGGRFGGRDVDDLRGVHVVRLQRAALRAPSWQAKRAVDVVGAVAGVVLMAPVLGAIAVAVKLTSPGPVLFRQTRLGRGGQAIELLKFRSMRQNGDSDTTWSVTEDDRVTRVGKVLRATSLDELPQLFNVMRGDVSLVGPRPERPFFAEGFSAAVPGYHQRLRVPVGMTGWAQIHGLRGDTSIEERAEFDNAYIDGWSLRRDLLILVRTVWPVLRDAAAFARRRRGLVADAGDGLAPHGADIDLRAIAEVDLTTIDEIDLRDGPAAALGESGDDDASEPDPSVSEPAGLRAVDWVITVPERGNGEAATSSPTPPGRYDCQAQAAATDTDGATLHVQS